MMRFVKAGTNSARAVPQQLREVDESQLLDIDALMGGGGRKPVAHHSVMASSSAPVPAYMKRTVQGIAPSRMAMTSTLSYSATLLQDVADYADDFGAGYMDDSAPAASAESADAASSSTSSGAPEVMEKVSLMKATRKLNVEAFSDPVDGFKGMSCHINFSMPVNGRIYRNDKS